MTTSAGPKSAPSRIPRVAATPWRLIVRQGDPRPITPALLNQLAKLADERGAAAYADPRVAGCRHLHADKHDSFCDCGALLWLEGVIESVTPLYGAAFALQQVFCGAAIANAQRVYRDAIHSAADKSISPSRVPGRRSARKAAIA